MLSNASLVAFIATADPAKARAFYESTLGLRCVSDDEYAVVFDANGTTLRIAKVQTVSPAPYTVLGWQVDDIERSARQLTAAGVSFERYDGMPQDALGIWTTPGGRIAWFRDPDGNLLSVSQSSSLSP